MILLSVCSFTGCLKMPPITACTYFQPEQMFVCVDRDGNDFNLLAADPKLEELKMIAIPMSDFGILLDYCHRKGSK